MERKHRAHVITAPSFRMQYIRRDIWKLVEWRKTSRNIRLLYHISAGVTYASIKKKINSCNITLSHQVRPFCTSMPAACPSDKNTHYGKFATTSRLIACLVSESLITAHFVPCFNEMDEQDGNRHRHPILGVCVVMRSTEENDILVAAPLRGLPVMNRDEHTVLRNGVVCTKIDLVDPWDMLPFIYAPQSRTARNPAPSQALMPLSAAVLKTVQNTLGQTGLCVNALVDDYDAVELWSQFAQDYGVNPELNELIASELASSISNQIYTYDHPKPLPNLNSSAIQWEQSIVEGHATHPMHKARRSYAPLPPLTPGQLNLETPTLRLLSIPRSSLQLRGDFEALAQPLVEAMLQKTGDDAVQAHDNDNDKVLIPVHEFQIPNVLERFKDVAVLPRENSVTAQALTSIRSVAVPDVLQNMTIKLCLGIKVTSALRTITPYTTYFGPGFSAEVVPRLTYDRKVLTIERELASAVYRHPDTDMAKHCSCVLREQTSCDGDVIIVAAALVEKIQRPDTDETLVKHVWGLDTEEKRAAFLDRYIQFVLKAFVPPLLENGVAFEAHGQNTLVRFDQKTGELKGFVIRDFGGVKVHNETLKRSCGVELDVLPDSCVVANSLDEAYKLLYHTLFHSQLQRLIRVLDMHHNGRGWEMVRTHFAALVPKDHSMYRFFMEKDKVPGKCLVRMKIEELYRDYIYEPVPNLILTQSQ